MMMLLNQRISIPILTEDAFLSLMRGLSPSACVCSEVSSGCPHHHPPLSSSSSLLCAHKAWQPLGAQCLSYLAEPSADLHIPLDLNSCRLQLLTVACVSETQLVKQVASDTKVMESVSTESVHTHIPRIMCYSSVPQDASDKSISYISKCEEYFFTMNLLPLFCVLCALSVNWTWTAANTECGW